MDEIRDRALAQMGMIEQIYSIKILNKEKIADLIAQNEVEGRQVLRICTGLNTWIAGRGSREDLMVPENVILGLIKAAGTDY